MLSAAVRVNGDLIPARVDLPIDAIFPIYSITKTLTAICVLRLAEAGALTLDASARASHGGGGPGYNTWASALPATERGRVAVAVFVNNSTTPRALDCELELLDRVLARPPLT